MKDMHHFQLPSYGSITIYMIVCIGCPSDDSPHPSRNPSSATANTLDLLQIELLRKC